MFVLKNNDVVIYILIYVDDFIITNNDTINLHNFINKVYNQFKCRDLSQLSYILGLEMEVCKGRTLVDSDWVDNQDGGKSTTCSCIYLGPNLMAWLLKKQATISCSIAKAEYIGITNVIAELGFVDYSKNSTTDCLWS